MPDSSETRIDVEQNLLKVNDPLRGAVGLEASSAPITTRSGFASPTTLTSIRGIPEQASKNISAMLNDPALRANSELFSIYSEEIKQLWLVGRLDPKLDRGAELGALLKRFCEDKTLQAHPELLSQLYQVATADALFGLTREQYQERGMDFNRVRREFLVDIIRGAVSSDNITQGKEPLCTIATACKMLSKAEFLRLMTEYAINGSVSTASGATMQMRPEFLDRAWRSSEATIGEVKCARRSAGMLMALYGMFQLGDEAANPAIALVDRQQGLYWHQYTRAVEKLLNEDLSCAHRSAKEIAIDPETGLALSATSAGAAKKVDLFGYVSEQLKHGRSVFIDTKFNFSSNSISSGSEHHRHALLAERFEMRGGQPWVRCSNPIGDFVDTSKSGVNHAEFFPVGTVLGDRRGFWFETAENGDILVRADVLQRNLQMALVQRGTPFTGRDGEQPQFIGDVEASRAGPIFYYDLSEDIAPVHSEPVAVSIHEVLGKLFNATEAPAMRTAEDEVQNVDRSGLATYTTQQVYEAEVREEKRESAQDSAPGFTSPISASSHSVVGSAFEYGREGVRNATAQQDRVDTVTGSAESAPQAAKPPVRENADQATSQTLTQTTKPSGSTTTIGLKTLFG
jgi:hypothetical protein